MSIRHYIQAFRATIQKLKAEDGVYIKSENIIVYEPDHIVSEIPLNGLVTKQNVADLLDGESSPSMTFELPAGSPIPMSFTDIGIFSSGFRQVLQLLLKPDGLDTVERVIYDVVVDAVCTDDTLSVIDHFEVKGHDDPDNPGFTIDDIRITLIK